VLRILSATAGCCQQSSLNPGKAFLRRRGSAPAGLKVEQVAMSFKNDLPGFGSLHWAGWRQRNNHHVATTPTQLENPSWEK
jgi:hypothetical protein